LICIVVEQLILLQNLKKLDDSSFSHKRFGDIYDVIIQFS